VPGGNAPPGTYPPPGAYGYPSGPYAPPGAYGYPPSGPHPSPFYPPRGPYNLGAPPPPANEHDGFYLHMQTGPSYLRLRRDGFEYSGGGMSFAISLGGAITPNLILYGTIDFTFLDDPTISQTGYSYGNSRTEIMLSSFGGGVAYYFMPLNVYLSGALLGTDWELRQRNEKIAESETGLGFTAQVGKEWWVSQNWGLGAAGKVLAASMKDDLAQRWNALTFAFLFSATYN
jgi:hypothetical protein